MDLSTVLNALTEGLAAFTWANGVMLLVGGVLIALAIGKEVEPVLLLPIGFGCLLANIPLTGLNDPGGVTAVLYQAGIAPEPFPLLIFVGVGAWIGFSPLLPE